MWLSSAPAVEPRRSPRNASSAPLHESMVQAAHQHLSDGSCPSSSSDKRPPPASQRTPRAAAPESIASNEPLLLDEHMESFPLVPLTIIPRLGLADLRRCECGLLQLLESLSGSDEDAQLGKYAGRQLSLVQRHVEQERARDRVLQLLSGDAPLLGAAAITTQSVKALPIFLTPPVNYQASSSQALSSSQYLKPEHNNNSHRSTLTPSPSAVRATTKSPLAKAAVRKKCDAIESARAMIKANLATSNNNSKTSNSISAFVISAGDHSSSNSNAKRRRRGLQKKKSTPEELEKARASQVERERERRKQEAYQRLIARQELQAEKKKKMQVSKPEKDAEPLVESVDSVHQQQNGSGPVIPAQPEIGGDLATSNNASQVSNASIKEGESESDDGSEVSNCSDSDEANEKAIMALQVQVREVPADDNVGALVPGERVEAAGDGVVDSSGDDEVDDGEDDDVDDEGEPQNVVLSHRGGLESDEATSCPQVDDGDPKEDPSADENKVEQEATVWHTRESEQIARDLQKFISLRKTAMIEQLQQQKQRKLDDLLHQQQDGHVDNQTAVTHNDSTLDAGHQLNQVDADRSDREVQDTRDLAEFPVLAAAIADSPPSQHQLPTAAVLIPAKQPKPASGGLVRKPQSQTQRLAGSTSRIGIPRTPAKPCKDYRGYFGNFHCILTSVFEQRHAFSSTNTSSNSTLSSSSRDSLAAPPHVPVNEQSLRIQLKLYESWQSIMMDYATVFGGNIAMPPSMLPTSSNSGLSPATAHYRINSTTRREVCDIVVTALEALGDWDEHPSGLGLKTTWNLLWTWSKPRVERKTLLAWQKVNHFQHAKALTRKDCLKKNMGKYLAMGGKMKQAYDVVPLTFILPHEYIAFVQAFQDKGARLRASSEASEGFFKKNIWIMKPVALSRGRGISLIDDLSHVVYGEQVVIQEYIANPLLLDGYKFDLRLYVLVTSFNPLEAFFYDEGFVRICTRQYEDADLTNLFVHLTNSSIQKENQDAIQARYAY